MKELEFKKGDDILVSGKLYRCVICDNTIAVFCRANRKMSGISINYEDVIIITDDTIEDTEFCRV